MAQLYFIQVRGAYLQRGKTSVNTGCEHRYDRKNECEQSKVQTQELL